MKSNKEITTLKTMQDSQKEKQNLIDALQADICDLLFKWDRYKFLFCSQEHIDLLNVTASTFFCYIQKIMLNDVFLHIASLTDSKKTCKNENLTILWLPDLPDDDKSKKKIDGLCNAALDKSKTIREVRHKLAHSDKKIALKEQAAPIVKDYVRQVEEAITAICDAFNEISPNPLSLASGIFDASGGDVSCLIEIIRAGHKQNKAL